MAGTNETMPSEDSEISRMERADTLGLAFLRTIILLNGGAILSVLTFMGNVQEHSAIVFELRSIQCAMWAFLAGIVSILIGLVVSYSYTATAPEYCWHKFWDSWIIPLNSILAVVSIAAFVFGVGSLIFGSYATK